MKAAPIGAAFFYKIIYKRIKWKSWYYYKTYYDFTSSL